MPVQWYVPWAGFTVLFCEVWSAAILRYAERLWGGVPLQAAWATGTRVL